VLITSVGAEDRTVWLHDKDGDHQISSEGNASSPSFSSDGRKLYFLMSNGQTQGEELWIKDLAGGKVDRVLPGNPMQAYSVSRDGKEVAFTMNDQSGHSNLWVAPTSRRTPPVRISSPSAEDSPYFLPDWELVFRAIEGGSNYLYRMKTDGSARKKISPERIDIYDSPRWPLGCCRGARLRRRRTYQSGHNQGICGGWNRHSNGVCRLLPAQVGYERRIRLSQLPRTGRNESTVACDA
jgi:Tol biopolymer transport system component